ncbi:CHASE domain-containing protein [Croceicoccus sp. F390]|uniref:histidine kinase n=1 Tax=Croceicoccus esteveae TaxID=3075597 RepID=A0ABU2ZKV7_9SPHN|nr:CHASE domain-containing protein [Croceicoccus sp. F390]MDT0577021.1 CHASE domain-containing protein [Croceicoccus sp. F390]
MREPPQIGGALRWFAQYPRALPIAIFLAIIAVTALGVWAIEHTEAQTRRTSLEQKTIAAAAALERRANAHSAYLRAGAALFSMQDEVKAQLFQAFIGQLRLDANFRGAEGIGWAERTDVTDIPELEARMSADDFGEFSVYPPPRDDHAYAVPIITLQPMTERNRRAIGYNMFSEQKRRYAMLEAEQSARPTATGRVSLVQETAGSDEAGFLIYMPVFRQKGSRDTRFLKGFVFSPFNARDFLTSALDGEVSNGAAIRLYDQAVAPQNLLAALTSRAAPGAAITDEAVTRTINVANRQWILEVQPLRARGLSPLAAMVLLAGLIVASLALAIASLLTRQAAEARRAIIWLEEQAAIRTLLTRELNHRVKNTLANVLSIISLTRRRAETIEDYARSLDGRIRALSATHDLLTQSEWGATPVRAVLEVEMAPYAMQHGSHLDLAGPDVDLAPNDALSLGLAVHELATNAAKYGALSVNSGKVYVHWDLVSHDLVRIRWREEGGPPVVQERRRGFGTDLIEKIVAHELRNPVDLVFEPAGVRCTMLIPVRRPSEFAMRARTTNKTDRKIR